MADFTPWTFFVDIGIISILLLITKFVRVKVKQIQKLLIPPSVLAGFLALILGPNGLEILPLSKQTGVYAGIFIAFVFGALPLISQKNKKNKISVRRMWAFSQAGMLLQWAFGSLLGLLILNQIWTLNPAFGIVMPCGFCGGHGTAAAIGQAFEQLGNDDILTLAMTAATFGVIAAIILGLVIIKWGTEKGHTSFLVNYKELPKELRTGLLPPERRESMGETTCSSISMDSLTFNFSIVVAIAFVGYCISRIISGFMIGFELPIFSCAFIVGVCLKKIFDKTKIGNYICIKTVEHISGFFTDLLISFGIASIKISVVVKYIIPLLVLLILGLMMTLLYVLVISRKFKDNWFEKAIFAWGWFVGTMAMGIGLLRIVDPKMKSHCLDSYALAYLFIAPIEILLITFAPMAFMNGYGLFFALLCFFIGSSILLFGFLKKDIFLSSES